MANDKCVFCGNEIQFLDKRLISFQNGATECCHDMCKVHYNNLINNEGTNYQWQDTQLKWGLKTLDTIKPEYKNTLISAIYSKQDFLSKHGFVSDSVLEGRTKGTESVRESSLNQPTNFQLMPPSKNNINNSKSVDLSSISNDIHKISFWVRFWSIISVITIIIGIIAALTGALSFASLF